MAGLVGIDINRVIAVTFMIGSALAAVAGVMVTLYITAFVPFFHGLSCRYQGVHRCVLGGIGSIPGAMVGRIMLGLIETSAQLSIECL